MITHMAASRSVVRDYVALTKPRIILMLQLTALGGMFLAAGGVPEASLVVLVLVGGGLAAGGANALNNSLERDVDALMRRTRSRPVAAGRIHPLSALAFGILLNLIAFAIIGTLVNTLSAVLTLSATLFYVLVYTMWLKRTTPQNIVIGGAAGAFPPVIGWTAVTGQLDLPAIYLFAIIFVWTPPHFWALALLLKDDYSRAGIPMLPVITSTEVTKRSILFYTLLLVALTSLFFTTGAVGWVYTAAAFVLGAVFMYYAWRQLGQPGVQGARSTYLYSLLYLPILFLAVGVDSLVGI